MIETYDELLGKTILAGLTYYSANNVFVEQKQVWGKVIKADESGLEIQQNDRNIFGLPPDLTAIDCAAPGEYSLKSTGEVVKNPDYLVTYSVTMSD